MSIKFLLLFTLIMGLLFYVITYPYQSKLVRKLKRVKSYEEVTFLKNSDLDYSKITKEDIDREITQEEGYIDSSFVSERMKYILITPNVDSYDNIPCLFLLHGLRDNSGDWTDRGKLLQNYLYLLKKGEIDPIIFVILNSGDEGQSWYSNYKCLANHNYEDYIIKELVPEIQKRFPKSKMGIAGFSMGGYGAYKIGLKHLEKFKVIGSFSGALSIIRLSVNRRVIRILKYLYIPKFLFSNPDKTKFLNIFSSWGYKILEEDPYTMIKKIDFNRLKDKYFYASVGLEDRVNHLMLQQWIDVMGRMKKKKCNFKGYLCRGEEHTWEYVARDMCNFFRFFNEKIK